MVDQATPDRETAARERVTVTVADSGRARIDDLVRRLEAEGMEVEQVLGSIGMVTGSVPAGGRAAITALADVAAVEGENGFQLPPPDADIQ
ncbi:MAG: hypothetical protein QOG43_3390 [Actinomycetota bacterium]|jgi:hypothetical protein|nr:hypothetical protein [Actinomycetota bacterium]